MAAVRRQVAAHESGSNNTSEPLQNDVNFAADDVDAGSQLTFPTTWSVAVFLVCFFLTVVLVPFLAFTIPPAEQTAPPWWKRGSVYQIYPRSFQDTDGDGVGDIKGIIERLGYIAQLGATAVWLSPVYVSPMKDFGYDVADYRDVDPMFGSLDDMKNLIAKAHTLDLAVLMDFVPNHSSNEHPWFQESRKSRDNPYADYYIWDDGIVAEDGSRQPPNNWLSVFTGSAWTWDDSRQQFYLHQFAKEQPDLNYRNPLVRQEMKDILSFWLELGVDGFRVDAIDSLFEVEDVMQDEPRSCNHDADEMEYDYLQHVHTTRLPEVHNVTREWRQLFDEYHNKTGKYIYMVVEAWNQDDLGSWSEYYKSGADVPFNFALAQKVTELCDGECMFDLVKSRVDVLPADRQLSWVTHPHCTVMHDTYTLSQGWFFMQGIWFQIGNHDFPRMGSIRGDEFVDMFNMLTLLLPGIPFTYYGDELGMQALSLSYEQTVDPAGRNAGPARYREVSRDPSRAPMQWNGEHNAGFSSAKTTWLPVHPDYVSRNIEAEQKDASSHLSVYRQLMELRRGAAFQWGRMELGLHNKNIFSFFRYAKGWSYSKYLIAGNMGTEPSRDNYCAYASKEVKAMPYGRVELIVGTPSDATNKMAVDDIIDLQDLELHPGQAVVVSFSFFNTEAWQT